MDDAANRSVDFVVIAGDLFNKRAIDALTLIHAIEGLKELKQRGIPVIAIEGNHDRSYYREGTSWLQFLCHQQYITLLDPRMQDGAPLLEPWNAGNMLGAYIDLPGGKLRVYGLKWQSARRSGPRKSSVSATTASRTGGRRAPYSGHTRPPGRPKQL